MIEKENLKDIYDLHKIFPKTRLILPMQYRSIYEKEYIENRGNPDTKPTLKHRIEHWMHIKVASVCPKSEKLLEIGAGTLNHLLWEKGHKIYDIIEPFTTLYKESSQLKNINNIYDSIDDIKINNKYDKIMSIAVLEHVEDLPRLIAKSALLLKENGVSVHAIPNEGGFLWYMAWRFGTGLAFRFRTGLSYEPLMRHEHINSAKLIMQILELFFDEINYVRYPTSFFHLSFYTFIEARRPNMNNINLFLSID